jgi:hypothetical protein
MKVSRLIDNSIIRILVTIIGSILILITCFLYFSLGLEISNKTPFHIYLWEVIALLILITIICILVFLFKKLRRFFLLVFNVLSFLTFIIIFVIILRGATAGQNLILIVFCLPLLIVPIGILFSIDFSINKGLNASFLITNILGIAIVCISYYFGFDLQWGFHNSALTWGSPLLLSICGILILILINIKFNKWIIGAAGCLIGFLAIAYFNILINSTDIALLDQNVNPTANTSLTEEEKIVTLILSNMNKEPGHFMVVYPSKNFHYIFGSNPQEAEEKKNEMKEFIENDPYMSGLIDKLFELNKQPYKLSLPSNLQEGYYIDYPEKFKNYIWRKNDIGFYSHRWDSYHPLADGPVSISKPYYDPKTGLVLAYVEGINPSPNYAITVFKYLDGKIERTGFLLTTDTFIIFD